MTLPVIQPALNAGELAPSMFGRVDLEKYKRGCSTLRNFYCSFRGGVYSRAGTKFAGQCKQGNQGTANSVSPPWDIPFQYSVTQGVTIEGGDNYFRFLSNSAYITETPLAVTGATAANPCVITVADHGYSNGDEVYLSGIVGTIGNRLNGRSFIIANVTTSTFSLVSTLTGIGIDAANFGSYTSGGTAARIYTLATPYAASDLPSLKYAQSADVMTLTHPDYPPYDLARIASDNWTLTETTFSSSIAAPASISVTQSSPSGSTLSFWYQFVMTAVGATTGEESIPSPVGSVESVDIGTIAATLTINGSPVSGAGSYNFYAAPETYLTPPTAGQIFGYIGTSFGPSFNDTNVTPDFSTAPPLHQNPFATSALLAVVMSNYGTSYSATATTASVVSPTGDDPVLLPVVINGEIQWTIVQYSGSGLSSGTTISFTDATGAGSGAAATLDIGPSSGTYPSCVSYFQQRRFYANTLNQPDTYFASQPGAFTNMDTSNPTVDSDAIIGSPWSQQVNGIQWMLNMPGGLVIFTGLGAWQLSGGGYGLATQTAITPSQQVANPQAYNGCSPLIQPVAINYDILYVQEMGSIVRDLSYNFFVNIYTGTDMTVLSDHLFDNYLIQQWGWSEAPNYLLWAVRNDGILLCLTFLKEQDVYAWSRHDTNGLFQSVCTISEPPVNAPYFVVKRLIQNDGNPVWAYYQERMDNRLWTEQEEAWCVDAGLSYPQSSPNAILTVSSSVGVPTLQQPTLVYGGANYSSQTYAEVQDPTGTGADAQITITDGVITDTIVTGLVDDYTDPVFIVTDPTGAGGGAVVNISSIPLTTVTASAEVFANAPGQGAAGDVIRMNGRKMQVIHPISSTTLTVEILRNDAPVIPNDPLNTAIPAAPGEWTISTPVTTLYGLDHLEGMQVSILADGVVVAPQTVSQGTITLPEPASAIVAGLGFTAQLQTLYLEVPGGVTVQGRRKMIDSVVVRLVESGVPFSVGVNQVDASTQPNQVEVPWTNLTPSPNQSTSNQPIQPYELFTGDIYLDVSDQLGETNGQIAIQQTDPLPISVLAVVPFVRVQDDVDAA